MAFEGSLPTVLVVEDEVLIRMDIAAFLADAGFETLQAGNAEDAIRILEERSDIRLVFTDIDMPGSMDGLRLAAFVRERWPPIKLIVTSGHIRVGDGDIPPGAHFFQKPYHRPDIARTIGEMITE